MKIPATMELVISHPASTADHHLNGDDQRITTAKGQKQRRSPAGTSGPPHLNGEDGLSPRGQHVCVTFAMFISFLSSLLTFSSVVAFHDLMTVTGILFSYYTAMLHLELIRARRGKNIHKQLQASQRIGTRPDQLTLLALVATGIMLVSLATAVSVFRPDWDVFAGLASYAFLSASMVYLPMKLNELQREKASLEKCEDASDLV